MRKFVSSFGDNFVDFFVEAKKITSFIGEVVEELFFSVKNPHKIKWRSTLYYMDGCGREATGIVALICFLMGLILGFQSAVQMKQFGTEIYVANLVGLSIVKELGPLMVAMIATGRAGSAFAAELGTMRVNEEIDALTTMGFVPPAF
ncbi:ABC transporter permease [Lentisphaera profundi]|uniref:ABC transporter permease n=1 Tax=Lentisphaera profundi TaxID=1658616 RepID=A0ABY7VNY9_9BACT|nr:ABC transporter permease [Lentisphaera profundi]WDE95868.1 ABC transporter permease [Lentisphaera profundi]